jgi:phosphoglycerate dehydrogenase-like enzyme
MLSVVGWFNFGNALDVPCMSSDGEVLQEVYLMKVLFLPFPPHMGYWYDGVVAAIDGRYPSEIYDPAQPMADQFKAVDVVVECVGCTREMIDVAVDAGVKLWQVLAVGLNAWDVAYFLEKGLPFANTPGPFSAVALAEHALSLMFLIAKNYPTAQENIRSEIFSLPLNDELGGKTLGLVGLGASGRELAKRAHAMGMRLVAIDVVDVPQAIRDELHVELFGDSSQLNQVLSEADYLSLHTPLTSKTRHLIDRHALELMKPTAVLINIARGEIVDEAALIETLRTGGIRAAGLDAFAHEPLDAAHPLLQMDNVICTPHIAGVTRETTRRRGKAVAENVDRVARGLTPLHLITSVE